MPNTITNSFITKWNDEVHHTFQQHYAKTRECVRVVNGVVGSTHKFHKIGKVSAQWTYTRHNDLTSLDPSHDTPEATLKDARAPIYLNTLDAVKTNADLRREYVTTMACAIGRGFDERVIVDGLEASAGGTEVVDATGGFTVAKILEAKKALDLADVPMEGRYFLLSPSALQEALNLEKVSSADYQQIKALVNGSLDSAFGFKFIMSTLLTKAGSPDTERLNWAFHRDAVGCAVGVEPVTTIDRVPEKDSWIILSKLSLGAVNIDNTGIVQVGTTDSDPDSNSLT